MVLIYTYLTQNAIPNTLYTLHNTQYLILNKTNLWMACQKYANKVGMIYKVKVNMQGSVPASFSH